MKTRWTRLEVALAAILGILLLYQTGRSIAQILDLNDFEVFHWAAQRAAARDLELYLEKSPGVGRPFVYPPSAAVLLMPLGALPFSVAAVVWSLLKAAVTAAFAWGSVRFASDRTPSRREALIVAAIATAFVFRPFNNDFGNGQINILVAGAATGGVWLMMSRGRAGTALGALLLALSAALKVTTLLLLAVPFLHRRWGALGLTLAFVAALGVGLPRVWFGADGVERLARDYEHPAWQLMMDAKNGDSQSSLYEAMVWVTAMVSVPEDEGIFYRDARLRVEIDGEVHRYSAVPPFAPEHATLAWLFVGVPVGIAFLWGRWRLFQGREVDWRWDLAMLCVLGLLLSPLVRKAHVVALLPAAAWIVTALSERLRQVGGWKAMWARHRALCVGLAAAVALSIASEDLSIPVGLPMPAHCAPMLMFAVLIAVMVALVREDATTARSARA